MGRAWLRRGWVLPWVMSWPVGVVAVNRIRVGVVLVAGVSWDRWMSGRSLFTLGDHVHWLLGGFIAYAIGTYLFYAQHNFPGVSFSDKLGWTHEKAALESSSFMDTNKIMAWFTANIG